MTRRLVIWDVDGTLVDSQAAIVHSMTQAFAAVSLPAPSRARMLSIVGLSLERAMADLVPEQDATMHRRLAEAYREAYGDNRKTQGAAVESPFYPGIQKVLDQLRDDPGIVMGVATGKSRRGLDMVIETHGLVDYFATLHCADDHPSKPHPAMLHAALAAVEVPASAAVMIGDTRFDMEMAHAAGMSALGVSWGYHPPEHLAAADAIVHQAEDLPPAIATLWERGG